MIRANFFKSQGVLTGFSISGHAGYAESGYDIVCSAVSSAVQLSANLITDGFHCNADVSAEGDTFVCRTESADENTAIVLDMLKTHLEFISEDFPKTIKITTSEV